MKRIILLFICGLSACVHAAATPSIARIWDEEILAAIRLDTPHPPVHARNLFHLSVAIYDAWAAYDPVAVGYLYRKKSSGMDVATARREAISYAAYGILKEHYALSRSASTTLANLSARMSELGYPTNNLTRDPATPAGVGNSVAALVSAFFINDGARQAQAYADWPASQGGYVPVNSPLVTGMSGSFTVDVNRWQPLAIANALDQNGFPAGPIQKFLGAQCLGVRPFALRRIDSTQPWINPGRQPRLGGVGDAQFRDEVVDVIRRSSQMTPDDGVALDISPGAFGNNSLGSNDGSGHPINPNTGQPYPPNVVLRGDFARVLAEFWADGPNSETPPGHWNTIANAVSDNPGLVKRLGGAGPVLDDLEWDVKLYFTLNAAVHDAACAAWSLKRFYDGGRPIEFIRYMGQFGQSSDPRLPSYDPGGLPLVPGLIELVTPATSQAGARHAGLPVDQVAIYAWPGQPSDPVTQHSGARWILPADWVPYQKKTFVTPAFPGYISGHSTFSRSAAEALTAMTGSPFFPGGLGVSTAPAAISLSFEAGPSQSVQLQWATYFDAADQAGLSRLWGGIHVSVDDLTGRRLGSQCGQGAWFLAQKYFDGSITSVPAVLAFRNSGSGQCELRCDTLRGFFYKVQSTADLSEPFIDDPIGFTQALDSSMVRVDNVGGSNRFYRVISAPAP